MRFIILIFSIFLSSVAALSQDEPVRVKAPVDEIKITPFTMLFHPDNNGVIKEKQKIDYDLTKPDRLRMGPFLLNENSVTMQISREEAEFVDVEFGLEIKRYIQSIYIISFTWPVDYVPYGNLEIVNDKSEIIWQNEVLEEDIAEWKDLLSLSSTKFTDQEIIDFQEKLKKEGRKKSDRDKNKEGLIRPQTLSSVHKSSIYGNSHKRFYDIPIADIKEPFRFCVVQRNANGRLALCSKRYQFIRKYGRYALRSVRKSVTPKIQVNDKTTTLRGTAVFLDYETPVKFSALMGNGTYFEFISNPKQLEVIDIAYDPKRNHINLIGFGDQPMGLVEKDIYADNIFLGFLNFMPTIGELRNYWRASMTQESPYLYVKGKGGAPFRQPFAFKEVPSEEVRPILADGSQKSTYSYSVDLKGKVNPKAKLSTPAEQEDASVKQLDEDNFEWTFIADKRGFNIGYLDVNDGDNTWRAQYELYRGFPGEISSRFTGVVSDQLDLVILGEVAGQYWFESLLGWDSYRLSRLRWGVAAKYFETLAVGRDDPENQGLVNFQATEANLKYRLDPGIWGRDPTVGLILGYQSISYDFRQEAVDINSKNDMLGVGAFWARSMPKIFDDLFNIIPFFRYPKWVDMEAIYYPLSFDSTKTQRVNMAFNFHGKVHWTERFFGEGGFGLKIYSYDDPSINKSIGFGIAYGTMGIGMNF